MTMIEESKPTQVGKGKYKYKICFKMLKKKVKRLTKCHKH